MVLEDTDGDGKADKCTHFMDDLNAPTGFQFYKDGVLLVQAPDGARTGTPHAIPFV